MFFITCAQVVIFSTFFLCLKESLYFQSFKLEIREIKTYRVMREGERKEAAVKGLLRSLWPLWLDVACVCVCVNI